ncbi:hypothetical protein [Conchiformibius kuhniae]|uniref:Phenylacetate--CoA ligase n=1 Tax=Conchiformibius kuhniae TaxID=211502 RepID=A0A8T9MTY5_9NEIS|nr:hypothetical protein [Conchiformibius kuhniae]UOP04285.1 hypothetical protein LVJ77_07820 [Conchiformibius kuhniae]
MMPPETLRRLFQTADDACLNAFANRHATLLALLDETWTRFQAEWHTQAPAPVTEYAADISPDQLSHHPIDEAETLRFFEHFERERLHNDSPFRNR